MKNKNGSTFITEDGVRVGNNHTVVVVDKHFKKSYWEVVAMVKENFENVKVFAHENNADNYIIENEYLFSYNDIIFMCDVPQPEVLLERAKERSKKSKK